MKPKKLINKDYITYYAINPKRKCYYIGYSKNGLEIRKGEHKKFYLKKNWKFYYFLREYGWDSFEWIILKHYNTETEMIQGEIDQIKIHKKKYKDWECLNTAKGGYGGDTFTDNSNKEEIRKKMREKKRDFLSTLEGEKWRKERSEWWTHFLQTLEGKKWIKERSEKTKKFNQTLEGKKQAKKHSEKQKGKNNANFGNYWIDEQKKALSKKMKGRYLGLNNPRARAVVLISPEGEKKELLYYKDFCLEHNLNPGDICKVLKGKQDNHKGWTGKYLNGKK